jgi:hypothetical protein
MKIVLFFSFFFFTAYSINAQNVQDTIHWKPDYRLKWEDFQGTPPNGWMAAAETNCGIHYSFSTINSEISFNTYCTLNKKASYVNISKADSFTLIHEQGHFDISGYYSEKLLIELNDAKLNEDNIGTESRDIFNQILRERNEMNDLYDSETLHGIDRAKQEEWNKRIEMMLNEIKKNKYR